MGFLRYVLPRALAATGTRACALTRASVWLAHLTGRALSTGCSAGHENTGAQLQTHSKNTLNKEELPIEYTKLVIMCLLHCKQETVVTRPVCSSQHQSNRVAWSISQRLCNGARSFSIFCKSKLILGNLAPALGLVYLAGIMCAFSSVSPPVALLTEMGVPGAPRAMGDVQPSSPGVRCLPTREVHLDQTEDKNCLSRGETQRGYENPCGRGEADEAAYSCQGNHRCLHLGNVQDYNAILNAVFYKKTMITHSHNEVYPMKTSR